MQENCYHAETHFFASTFLQHIFYIPFARSQFPRFEAIIIKAIRSPFSELVGLGGLKFYVSLKPWGQSRGLTYGMS